MAVPTIATVTPSSGPTLADHIVSIVGTNFATPTLPPVGVLSSGALAQTAQVLFGSRPGLDVRVYSSTLITARPPRHTAGAVNVSVQNLNPTTGLAVAGELATKTNGYTYALPIYTADAETDFTRTIRTLLQQMKEHIFGTDAAGNPRGDVSFATQTDYVQETGESMHIAKFARLPGIALIGPDLVENRFYSLNEEPTLDDGALDDDGATGFVRTRVPYTVDILFDVMFASDSKIELLNCMVAFVQFMHHTKLFSVDRDASDPSKGTVDYEIDFQPDGQPRTNSTPNNSNLRSFIAKIVIRGFDIEAVSGISIGSTNGVPNQAIVEHGQTLPGEVTLSPTHQMGVSSRVGPSPG